MLDTLTTEDYDGYTFNIMGEAMRDYYFAEDLNGEVINDALYNRNKTVEDIFNIELAFDILDWGTGQKQIIKVTTAGENAYDLLTCTHLYLGSVITNGSLQSWTRTDAIDLDAVWYVKAANETYSIGDNYMLLFGDFLESNIRNAWCMIFNKQKAEEYNLPSLYDAVDSGEWTIDYLMTITQDIADDLDGNGKYDGTDFYGFVTDSYAGIDSFSRTCNLSAISKDSQNYPVLDFFKESTVDAFDLIYKLYYEHNGTFVNKAAFAHIDDIFATGHAIISNTMIIFLQDEAIRDMDDDFGVVPYPKMTESQEMGYAHLDGTFSAMMLAITLPDEDIERTALVTEALNALGYDMVTPALYEITLQNKLTRDEDSVRMMDLVLAGRRYSFDSLDEDNFPFSPCSAMRKLLAAKNKDIASYYEANKAKAEAWIEKIVTAYEESRG